jgi:hypothetical protein
MFKIGRHNKKAQAWMDEPDRTLGMVYIRKKTQIELISYHGSASILEFVQSRSNQGE